MPKTYRRWNACPNCNGLLRPEDNFCPNCGQENHDLNVPLRKLLPEVLENLSPISLTSVNNKFWNSIKAIFTRPGWITTDFLAGRRARYVPPIRLYVLVSIVFFLVLGRVANKNLAGQKKGSFSIKLKNTSTPFDTLTLDDLVDADTLEHLGLDGMSDVRIQYPSATKPATKLLTNLRRANTPTLDSLLRQSNLPRTDSNRTQLRQALALLPSRPAKSGGGLSIGIPFSAPGKPKRDITFATDSARKAFAQQVESMSDQQLDSVIAGADGEPGWANRLAIRRAGRLMQFENVQDGGRAFMAVFLKNLPGVMFVLMPFVALLLWLFYARRSQYRRHYYEHLIFSIHIHTALFLFATLGLGLAELIPDNPLEDNILVGLGWVCWLYFGLTLRQVYRQSWLRTSLKWLLISLVYAFTVSLFMIGAVVVGALLM